MRASTISNLPLEKRSSFRNSPLEKRSLFRNSPLEKGDKGGCRNGEPASIPLRLRGV